MTGLEVLTHATRQTELGAGQVATERRRDRPKQRNDEDKSMIFSAVDEKVQERHVRNR